jgi:hypothetical protein
MIFRKSMVAAALGIAATCGVASAQGAFEGRTYIFHSKASGACPALDWHLVAESNGVLEGMLSWDSMKSMAHASGTVNVSAKTFEVKAVEVGGQGRTAMITGTVRSDGWLIANIKGPNIDCQGITVPWYVAKPAGGNG